MVHLCFSFPAHTDIAASLFERKREREGGGVVDAVHTGETTEMKEARKSCVLVNPFAKATTVIHCYVGLSEKKS